MIVEYDVKELNKIVKSLSILLNVGVIFYDKDLKPLAIVSNSGDYCSMLQTLSFGKALCRRSDYNLIKKCNESKKAEYHLCHAGLFDIAVPILKEGDLVGIVELGRIRLKESPKKSKYSFSDGSENDLYNAIKIFNKEELESLMVLLPYILEDKGITFREETLAEEIDKYVKGNLANDLTLNALCKKFCLSKNSIYKEIKNRYNLTVNDFVTNERLLKAKQLLKYTDKSIMKISEEVGIDNYTYFCKLFKKLNGLSPNQYRKEEKFQF